MQEIQGDTRFVPEVQPIIKVAYVSIEVITKSRVSFNPIPPKLPPRSIRFSLSIPTKRRVNFSGLHHNPWELPEDTWPSRGLNPQE
jgi:hypothetical protein